MTTTKGSSRPDPTDVVFAGNYFSLRRDSSGWEYLKNNTGRFVVALAGITSENNLVLVKQHRPPVDGHVLELPAGVAESDNLAEEARRELREETAFDVPDPQFLFATPVCSGLTDSILYVYWGRASALDSPCLASTLDAEREDCSVVLLPLEPLLDSQVWGSATGKLIDQTIFATLYHLRACSKTLSRDR